VFAVKKARFGKDNSDQQYRETLQKELDICKDLRHRHIVSCKGWQYVDGNLYIYLEYIACGSLRQRLSTFGALRDPLLQKATRGIVSGLKYLHTHKPPVAHRDLKCANILTDAEFCVKLADFGCSHRSDSTMCTSKCGSLPWVAPEVLKEVPHGRSADIWSFGCVMIEMATADDPWGRRAFNNAMQAQYIIALTERLPPFPETLTSEARNLLELCLQRDPERRLAIVDIAKHVYVQQCASRLPSRASSRPSSRPPSHS
jgi:serine/threonine protein kinase